MAINFSFNVDRKIIVNGKEYASVDQIPGELRKVYDAAMVGGVKVDVKAPTLNIVFNGKEYNRIEDMPENERRVYEQAISSLQGRQVFTSSNYSINLNDLVLKGAKHCGFFDWFFPRKLMQWVEPAVVRTTRYEVEKRRLGKFVPMIIILSCLGIFILGKMQPSMDMKPLYMALLGVIAIMFVILYAYKVTPGTISITDKAIIHDCGDDASFWNFSQIEHCEISSMNSGGGIQNILVIHLNNGGRKVFGIDKSVNTNDLRLLLEGKGVKVVV